MKAIVLSTNNYLSFPSRKQRFARHLVAQGFEVLYVEAPVTVLAAALPGQRQKIGRWKAGIVNQGDGLWTASPSPWLPFFKQYERIADHDAAVYYRWLRNLSGSWVHDAGLVLTYMPFVPRTLELIGAPVLYDCVDDHSAYPGFIDKNTVNRLETRTAQLASGIIATNETIAGKFRSFEAKTSLIQNGVDHHLFAEPALTWLASQSVLQRQRKFLYVGAMREWFDTRLVSAVAKLYPEWTIDCYGDATPSVRQELAACTNVVLCGNAPQAVIAQLAGRYDVALIPFRECPLTAGIDPLKFYEYSSAGLPVVSSRINALGVFGDDMVRMASTAEEFAEAVAQSMTSDSLEVRRWRIESSHRFDWSYRLQEFDRALEAIRLTKA